MFTRHVAAAALVALVLAGCSGGVPSGGQFEGTQWVLSSYLQDGTLTIAPESIFADATFENSVVTGLSGCNSYRALYQAGGRSLRISQSSRTLMACDQPTMDFETTFTTLLNSSRFFSARDDMLTIYDPDRTPILIFDAAPRNPLLGRWDVGGFETQPSTVAAPIEGTTLDVVFGIASVGGSSGCNSFSGTYGTNGTVVRIGPLASTRLACDQPVMDQEAAFLNALQGVARIDYRGSTLNLTDRQGRLVVGLTRPVPEPSPSAGPSASGAPSAAPSAPPSAKPSTAPTATPTATPTPTPTPTPSPTPAPSATAAPTAGAPQPSASIPVAPVTATCDLAVATGGATVAKLVYPGTWQTVTEPPELACRYFDPAEITVPADPTTLQTAVMTTVSATPYADAVTAATDPANWTVVREGTSSATGVSITCVDATALTDAAGIPTGSSSHSCLVDVGSSGTVVLRTVSATADEAFATNAAVVSLMTLASSYTPTG